MSRTYGGEITSSHARDISVACGEEILQMNPLPLGLPDPQTAGMVTNSGKELWLLSAIPPVTSQQIPADVLDVYQPGCRGHETRAGGHCSVAKLYAHAGHAWVSHTLETTAFNYSGTPKNEASHRNECSHDDTWVLFLSKFCKGCFKSFEWLFVRLGPVGVHEVACLPKQRASCEQELVLNWQIGLLILGIPTDRGTSRTWGIPRGCLFRGRLHFSGKFAGGHAT